MLTYRFWPQAIHLFIYLLLDVTLVRGEYLLSLIYHVHVLILRIANTGLSHHFAFVYYTSSIRIA